MGVFKVLTVVVAVGTLCFVFYVRVSQESYLMQAILEAIRGICAWF